MNPPGGLESIELWQANIEQDQIRFQLLRFPDRFQSVRCFSYDLQEAAVHQRGTDELPKRHEIFYHQNTVRRRLGSMCSPPDTARRVNEVNFSVTFNHDAHP